MFVLEHKGDKKMVLELVQTLNCLIVRNEFCAKVEENGGIPFVIDVLTEYMKDEVNYFQNEIYHFIFTFSFKLCKLRESIFLYSVGYR